MVPFSAVKHMGRGCGSAGRTTLAEDEVFAGGKFQEDISPRPPFLHVFNHFNPFHRHY